MPEAEALPSPAAPAGSMRFTMGPIFTALHDPQNGLPRSREGFSKTPPPKSYATPGFSEKPTSNIGQPDVYKHAARHTVNRATLPRSLTATGSTMDVWAKPTIEKPIMSTTSSRGSGTITMGPAAAELLK